MQKSKERMVSFFDVSLTAHTYGQKLDLAPMPLSHFVAEIKRLHGIGQCPKMGRNAAETIYLADIKIDPARHRAELLINRSDRDASDTVYSDPTSNSVRSFRKNTGEGNDFSAHIVVSLSSRSNKYLAILELSPGLASGKISAFLNYLIRWCVKKNKATFQVAHPNGSTNAVGTPLMVTAYHKLELMGHPSDEFLNSLNGGILESIELIDRRKANLNWDTNGHTKEVARTVILRPGPKNNAPNFRRIKEAAALAYSRKYDSARVRFKTAQGVASSVTIDTGSVQLASDIIFVKKEKISGFSEPLETSY